MDFRLLGPVELRVADQRHDLGSARARCVLAILAVTPGQLVPGETLIDGLWGENLPPSFRATLHAYVSRLRASLRRAVGDEASVVQREGGYVLDVDPDTVDLHRFRRLFAQARALAGSRNEAEAADLLRDAESLWRGAPLAGLTVDWAVRYRAALEQERQAATFDRIRLELTIGRHADLVGELVDLVGQLPLNETAVEYLMIALYRCGRQADALHAYRQARERIVGEISSEPTAHLQEVHRDILRGDPALAAPAQATAVRPAVANNLRRDIAEFVGRAGEMQAVLDAVRPGGVAVPVVAIHGMPGAGKTALAVRIAHQLADNYPDGQLFVELRGHHPTESTVDPASALDVLLRLLGVPVASLPPTMDERAALWRARLSGRRVLLVLDDVAGPDQVSPLLPGAPDCLVLITSRQRLTGLGGVKSVSLPVLAPDDAAELLRRVAGADRTADAEGTAEVVRLCGGLPLALRLAASRLREHSSWSVRDLADRLARGPGRPGRTRLDDVEIAGAFELSYQDLTPRQQRVFRALGLHPAASVGIRDAAVLADVSVAEAERLLDGLYDHHLVEEPTPGRYRLHDLLCDYARDLAVRDETEGRCRSAVHRLLDYYLDIADRADRILHPHRRRLDVRTEHPPAEPPALRGRDDARAWLEAERSNLVTAARHATEHGWPQHAALLAHVLAGDLETGGYWEDATAMHERAVGLWRELGDRAGETQALLELSAIEWRAGRHNEATHHAEAALAVSREMGSRWGEAAAYDRIGLVCWYTGRYQVFLDLCRRALDIFGQLDDQSSEAAAISHVGIALSYLGRFDDALAAFRGVVEICRTLGDRHGERDALNNAGEILLRLGHPEDAIEHYRRSREIIREIGGRQHAAIADHNLGVAYTHTGNPQRGLDFCRRALKVYRELGDRQHEALVLVHIGAAYQALDRFGEAAIHHQKAFTLAREIADPAIQAQASRGIGEAHLGQRRYSAALTQLSAAVELARRIGDRYEEGRALDGVGQALLHTQGLAAAEAYWDRALELYAEIGVPEAEAEAVRSRLRRPYATGS